MEIFSFDIGEKLLEDFFVQRFRHDCKNCLLRSEENVSRKNNFSKMVIFALPFSDFEQTCFWLLAEKFRHSRQNYTQVYVARLRRKQLFWKYSALYIDAAFRTKFCLFSLTTFRQGCRNCIKSTAAAILGWKIDLRGVLIEKPISVPEQKVFELFVSIFSAGLFELLFICPEDHFDWKKFWIEILVY